jgi:hypothetical protein
MVIIIFSGSLSLYVQVCKTEKTILSGKIAPAGNGTMGKNLEPRHHLARAQHMLILYPFPQAPSGGRLTWAPGKQKQSWHSPHISRCSASPTPPLRDKYSFHIKMIESDNTVPSLSKQEARKTRIALGR